MKPEIISKIITGSIIQHLNCVLPAHVAAVGQAVIDTLRELPREDVERAIWGNLTVRAENLPDGLEVKGNGIEGRVTTTETGYVYHPDPLAPLKPPMLDELCRKCGGSGDVITRRSYGIDGGYMYSAEVCEACHGEGKEITNTNSGNATEYGAGDDTTLSAGTKCDV